jgi:hypothetical protein
MKQLIIQNFTHNGILCVTLLLLESAQVPPPPPKGKQYITQCNVNITFKQISSVSTVAFFIMVLCSLFVITNML